MLTALQKENIRVSLNDCCAVLHNNPSEIPLSAIAKAQKRHELNKLDLNGYQTFHNPLSLMRSSADQIRRIFALTVQQSKCRRFYRVFEIFLMYNSVQRKLQHGFP